MTPTVGAVGICIHLAFHHDHVAHSLDLDSLDAGATDLPAPLGIESALHRHGMDHAPDHEHEAHVGGGAPALRPGPGPLAVLSVLRDVTPRDARATEPDSRLATSPRPLSDPLFQSHCSLLL